MARRIVALDISSQMLKAAVIESSLRQRRVIDLCQRLRDFARPLAEQLREFRTEYGLFADTVLSCLPGDAVFFRMLTLPFTRARQLEQTVPFELASQLPLELDTLVVDFHIVQQTPEGTTVLAVAAPKITLTEHLATLSEAGFDPTRISLAPLAPLAMLTAARAELSGSTLLLHIEANRTDLVFLHNGMLSGLRTLSIGLNHASEFPTFLRELRWTLLAFGSAAAPQPDRVFLCGEGSQCSQLCAEFRQALTVELVLFDELKLSSMPASLRTEQGTYAVCLGLGLQEALGLTTPTVNLRQGAFVHHGQQAAVRRELFRLGWLAAGVAAAAGLTFALEMHGLNTRYDSLRREIRGVFAATLPEVHTIINEKAQLQDAVETFRSRQHVLQGAAAGSPLEFLRQLSTALPAQIRLDLDEWTFDTDAIHVQGSTTSFDTAEVIKTTVASLDLFRDVQLKDVKTTAGGKKVSFSLHLLLGSQKAERER